MEKRRRIGSGTIGFIGVIVPMVIPELTPWIGWPLIFVGVVVFGLSYAPEYARETVRCIPQLKPLYGPLDWAIELICGGTGEGATITAGEALQLLNQARPNSIETIESRLRDKASAGFVSVWGKKISKDFIQLYHPSLVVIPLGTWAYAKIDTRSISGPLQTNSLTYLSPYGDSQGALYNAVRFSKQEILELCRAESI